MNLEAKLYKVNAAIKAGKYVLATVPSCNYSSIDRIISVELVDEAVLIAEKNCGPYSLGVEEFLEAKFSIYNLEEVII